MEVEGDCRDRREHGSSALFPHTLSCAPFYLAVSTFIFNNKLVILLLMRMKFFHRVTGETFLGTHAWRMRYSGKIYWGRNKRLPPGAQCLIHDRIAQLCLSCCGRGPVLSSPNLEERPVSRDVVSLPGIQQGI